MMRDKLAKYLPAGSHYYRAYVGPARKYDLIGGMQFNLLTFLGLREYHFLLDIGCGSLRGGRLFIPYLLPGRYFGIEPKEWLIEEGIKNELGDDIIDIKRPVFSNENNFTLSMFNRKFDFILAQSIFSHASPQQIRRCLAEAKEVMMRTSIFAATFIRGEKNYTGSKWLYPGRVTYTLEYMRSLAEEAGLICKPIAWPHPNQQTWIAIVNPENANNVSDPSNITRLARVENELAFYKERLYVRLGLKIAGFVQRAHQRIYEWKR